MAYDRLREELKAQMQVEMESYTLKMHVGKNLSWLKGEMHSYSEQENNQKVGSESIKNT